MTKPLTRIFNTKVGKLTIPELRRLLIYLGFMTKEQQLEVKFTPNREATKTIKKTKNAKKTK